MLGLQGGTLGSLGVKRCQGGHRGGHFVLQGCRPCWWWRERLGVLEHFAGGEGGALGVHNHCRGGGKRVPGHWGSCFWGAWVRTATGWGVPRHAGRGWGCLGVLDRGRAAGGLSESRVQRGIGSGWPCWGCRRGPAPGGGHRAAPAHLQPLLFGHLPLVLLVCLVPDENFLDAVRCVLGRGTE